MEEFATKQQLLDATHSLHNRITALEKYLDIQFEIYPHFHYHKCGISVKEHLERKSVL